MPEPISGYALVGEGVPRVCKACKAPKSIDCFREFKKPNGVRYRHRECLECQREDYRLRSLRQADRMRAAAIAGEPIGKRWLDIRSAQRKKDSAKGAALKGRKYLSHDERCIARAQKAERDKQERASRRLHDAHVTAWRRSPGYSAAKWRTRYANDHEFALGQKLRMQFRRKAQAVPELPEVIRAAIKRGDARCGRIERLLGYTLSDLRRHIERQFVDNMSWACWSRYGWHIDHILPRKYFDLTTIEGVRAYWALPNLRPLWAGANLKKAAKREFLI